MSVGFTPEIFSSLLKAGADRAIAVHSKRPAGKDAQQRARETINEIRRNIDTKEERINDAPFENAVRDCIKILESTGKEDELFVHIGGGERHIALALLYATLFVKRNTHLIVTMRTGELKPEILPAIPSPYNLSEAQKSVLNSVGKGRKLKDVVAALKGKKEKDYPRIYRHLENLAKLGLVTVSNKKEYTRSLIGNLVVDGFE
ncbi:MAG: hypothetical protein WC792_04510 [Candidatus Micrarchaeia archaeon]|jgi:CRISPR locus-related DNA-binding protein